ncbi:FKBP-type peptidyl-prolyl cis-trans isomerase [Roseivirga sp. E12]|uniref:FKBP-type peptidyl-prolyl cis-trans isomerase n=1 Tax=Roseivirga sp. E12 TaxID=2819237 RepID=UPI001ABC6AA5|nr:FKBP-type peptidyl-prolyl cis-trans isomerase [Roseivirga sp. E12]MBO3696926.1 FKBP-type peptidyl-prolyl cis-trans isomerase [Roseivirga sp. E12]
MLKKTFNLLFASLIVSTAIFMQACSGSGASGSDSDTVFLASGVKYLYLERGNGPKIDSLSRVSTHINLIVAGDTVWSTYSEGEQIFEFDAKRTSLIKGFDEVVMYGRQGDRILAIIPPELGYGARGAGDDIPPNATLQFDLNMIKVAEPKIFLADVLFPIYEESGVEEMFKHYQSLDLDTATYRFEIGEWYTLHRRMVQDEKYQDAVAMWDFKLPEVSDLGGYFSKAQAQERLGQVDEAITTLNTGLETATDTTNADALRSYIMRLKGN